MVNIVMHNEVNTACVNYAKNCHARSSVYNRGNLHYRLASMTICFCCELLIADMHA